MKFATYLQLRNGKAFSELKPVLHGHYYFLFFFSIVIFYVIIIIIIIIIIIFIIYPYLFNAFYIGIATFSEHIEFASVFFCSPVL